MTPRWEYIVLDSEEVSKLMKRKDQKSETEWLNELGEQGWELAGVFKYNMGPVQYYFKRQVPRNC